jgi:hypothetical protein
MVRFLLGLFFGAVLTVEALAIAGVGHGSYAPLILTASVAALIPFLGLFAGPLLWAFYFLLIPNLDGPGRRVIALVLVSLLHFGAGLWAALGDPAFARTDSAHLLIFGISVLVTMGFLLFFTIRRTTIGD